MRVSHKDEQRELLVAATSYTWTTVVELVRYSSNGWCGVPIATARWPPPSHACILADLGLDCHIPLVLSRPWRLSSKKLAVIYEDSTVNEAICFPLLLGKHLVSSRRYPRTVPLGRQTRLQKRSPPLPLPSYPPTTCFSLLILLLSLCPLPRDPKAQLHDTLIYAALTLRTDINW